MSATFKYLPESWNDYRIERVDNSHLSAISALLNTTSKANFSSDFLQKKYATKFLGANNIGYVAFDDNVVVSHQMGLLIELVHKDKVYLSIQSCDSATHPDYTKKGLWAVLNDCMFQQAPIEHISGVLGLPNQNSYSIAVNKLGYQIGGIFKNYSISVHEIPLWRAARRLGLEKRISQRAESSLKKYQIPAKSFSSFDENDYLIINRTPAYLNYKLKMGSFFIQLYDTTFWIKIRSQNLFIGDLKTPSEQNFKQAINKLKSICYWAGLEAIIFQTQAGSFEESLFEKYYPAMDTMPMLYKTFDSTVPYHLLKYTYSDLDTF